MGEVNEVPKGWVIEQLGSLCQIVSGNTPKELGNISNKGTIQFYKVSDMNLDGNQFVMCESNNKLTEDEIIRLKVKIHPAGTVIFPKRGGAILTNKKRILGRDSAFDLNLMGIVPNDFILSKFLFYYFFKLDLSKIYDGSSVPQINNKNVDPLPFPLPPLLEQHRIVAKIEELFTNLDKGIESLKTAQQQLKIYRQAVLKWAFEGKLTNKGVTEGELPEGWKWVKLADLIDDIKAGKSFKCDERPPSKDQVGILKVSAISWGVFDEMESKTVTDNDKINFDYLVEPGDFILSRANTLELVGAVVIVKSISKRLLLSDKTLRITFSPFLSDQYALYYLRSKNGRNQIQGYSSGNQESMRNIGQAGIKNIEVPLPKNIEEQHQIVAEIESRLSVCDKIEETISQSLQQAEALRQSILKKAFEGTLVPQDPNDEPASVLLERIRAEREVQEKPKPVKTKKVKKAKAERVPEVGEQLKLL